MKKTLSVFLALVMVFALLPVSAFAADGDAAVITLTSDATGDISIGTQFTVTVTLSNNTVGICALGITPNWNSSVVRLDGFAGIKIPDDPEDDATLEDSVLNTMGGMYTLNSANGSVQWAGTSDKKKNGTICAWNFTVIGEGDPGIVIQREYVNGIGGFEFKNAAQTAVCTIDETALASLCGVDPNAHVHSLTAHAAVAATCTSAGSNAYWSCKCDTYFDDAAGVTEIAKDSWVIPALPHTLTAHEAVEATETATGITAYWDCRVCGKFFSDAEGVDEIAEGSWVTPMKNHTHVLTAHPAVEATATTKGNTAYWSCGCGLFFSDAAGETVIAEGSWVTPATGIFSVKADTEKVLTNGEDVVITLSVSAPEDSYNAYFFELTYDASMLTYKSINLDDATVTANNGTLIIAGYGANKTANPEITFTAVNGGQSNVELTAAKLDISGNAALQNAPDADIINGVTEVTVKFNVTLPDTLTGEPTVGAGEDYSFTAIDPYYDYTVTATMGGTETEVIVNNDGSYTIAAITDDLVITETHTGKVFNVTYTGKGAADLTDAPATATYKARFLAKLGIKNGYRYIVTATINGESVPCSLNQIDIQVDPSYIKGDMVINIDKTYNNNVDNRTVTVTGRGKADVTAAATAREDTDYTFTLTKADGYIYTLKTYIGEDEITLTPAVEGNVYTYTIPGAELTADVTIDVDKTVDFTADVVEYLKLSDQASIWLVTAACPEGTVLPEGETLCFDGNAMFSSEKYGAFAWLVIAGGSKDDVVVDGMIAQTEGTSAAVVYSGDVNGTGLIDVNDAQLVYNMYKAVYSDFSTVPMAKFLAADVNGDKSVNTDDAAAVVSIVLQAGA